MMPLHAKSKCNADAPKRRRGLDEYFLGYHVSIPRPFIDTSHILRPQMI